MSTDPDMYIQCSVYSSVKHREFGTSTVHQVHQVAFCIIHNWRYVRYTFLGEAPTQVSNHHLGISVVPFHVILLSRIQVKFEIPYFTVSGIQVRYLKIIEKSGYQALPWVR